MIGPLSSDLLICRVADLQVGIDIRFVQEVNRLVQATPVPHVSAEVLGLVNLRGNLITVFDLVTILTQEPLARTATTRNVVVDYDGERFGILVDSIGDVAPLVGAQIEALPSHTPPRLSTFFHGLVQQGGQAVLILDLEAVLTTNKATS